MRGHKSIKAVESFQKDILSCLNDLKWHKLDDIMTELEVKDRAFNVNFDRAWRELIVAGYIYSSGNEIKLKI